MLVSLELVKGKAEEIQLDVNFPLTPHFRLYELANLKGNPKEPQYVITPQSLAFNAKLEAFRKMYKKPMVIQPTGSGYRQPAYNKIVGGIKNSAHTYARALDYFVQYTDRLQDLWRVACNGRGHFIIYDWGIHIDDMCDTFKVIDRRKNVIK